MALGVIYRKIRERQQSSGMNAALPPVRKYRRGRFIKAAPRPPVIPPGKRRHKTGGAGIGCKRMIPESGG